MLEKLELRNPNDHDDRGLIDIDRRDLLLETNLNLYPVQQFEVWPTSSLPTDEDLPSVA